MQGVQSLGLNPADHLALESRRIHAQRRRIHLRHHCLIHASIPPPHLLLLTCASVAALAEPRKFDIPVETGTYRAGEGSQFAQAFCLNCHSTEYVEMQPPMPEKFWDASVKKMKDKFGATLPDDITPLVKYLTATYGAQAVGK